MDHGDVVYYQPNNETFYAKLESVQYNAALDITGGIKPSSNEKIYKELSLEYQCGLGHVVIFTILKYIVFHSISQN